MDEILLQRFLRMDAEEYQSNFAAIEAHPIGAKLLRFWDRVFSRNLQIPEFPSELTVKEEVLILTDRYPNEQALYRNGFVHRRVKLYADAGISCTVFCMDALSFPQRYAFDGVTVTAGGRCELYRYLSQNPQIRTVCVHFLDQRMWDVLRYFSHRLIIWSHGSDILHWSHRPFLYPTEAEQRFAIIQSEKRKKFWRGIFLLSEMGLIDAQFVYVSDYLRGLVAADHEWEKHGYQNLRTHVIHNCIDTGLFAYAPKTAEQRLKLISVRSYDSSNYANDLTVQAIELLSKEPFFDKLSFLIAGNGEQFDALTKPLKKFKNVTLHKGFYRQDELAALYREYGVAILPTRFDTQGVSRDEACACGMAVITTDCACYREFANEQSSMPVKPESAEAIATAIKRLYEDQGLFLSLSKNARERAERLSAEHTVKAEIRLIEESLAKWE